MTRPIIALSALCIAVVLGVGSLLHNKYSPDPSGTISGVHDSTPNEFTGWVPYWKEPEAYQLLDAHSKDFTTVSPVWFLVNDKLQADFVGLMPKEDIVKKMHDNNLQVTATVSSELIGEDLTPLLQDSQTAESLILDLTARIKALGADGIDLDLEQVAVGDKYAFTEFVRKLASACKKNNLRLAISVHAQTGSPDDWEGVKGQDLVAIGKLADEVRIMVYDFHGPNSPPGAITPIPWLRKVITYTLQTVPKEKIVIGLPTYGYLWKNGSTDPEPLQFGEFKTQVIDAAGYTSARDSESGELQFTNATDTAWVSDAEALAQKIMVVRQAGLNRFALWSLGGVDPQFFQ